MTLPWLRRSSVASRFPPPDHPFVGDHAPSATQFRLVYKPFAQEPSGVLDADPARAWDDLSVTEAFDEIRLSDFPEQPFLIAATDQVIRSRVQESGSWEPGFAAFVASLLPDRPRIVIGGGHIGLSAFQLWKERPDIAELVVFEPDGLNAGLLALNVWNWGETPVRVMPMALGRRIGEVMLARNPSNTGDNRLWEKIPPSLEAGGGDPETWLRQNVVVVALDEIWRGGLDLLLLDTQGWEPDVLAGARRLILEQRPAIVFEWWPQALAARGLDSYDVLTWLERDLRLRLDIVPSDASGIHELMSADTDVQDVRELTGLLLEHPEPWMHAELFARPWPP